MHETSRSSLDRHERLPKREQFARGFVLIIRRTEATAKEKEAILWLRLSRNRDFSSRFEQTLFHFLCCELVQYSYQAKKGA